LLETMHLESINVGQVETISHNQKSFATGICKYPIEGVAYLEEVGVRGDSIVDTEHHGGVDQAVYAYSSDDYDWWAGKTGRDLSPGIFGENLTIRGLASDMNVGDRLLIGEVVLEATAPRIPCSTFATRMQDSGFGLAFREAERPGIYFRVLNAGEVSVGTTVTYVVNDASDVSILDLFRFNYALHHDKNTLRRFLDAPLAIRFRTKIEAKLESLERNSD
jgi:MOSC domain-containing protein YiiM